MNNLQRIKAAYAMNYSATICINDEKTLIGQVIVSIANEKEYFVIRDDILGIFHAVKSNEFEDFIITGYFYMGQLGGNEPVPEGQRFRLTGGKYHDGREFKEVITSEGKLSNPKFNPPYIYCKEFVEKIYKNEIEPVF